LFFLLVIEIFGCLHQQVESFLHWCANIAWNVKGFSFYLCSFYKQRLSMALQQTQATFILKHVLIINEDFFRVIFFPNVVPFSLFNMLLAIGGVWVLDLFLCPLMVHLCWWLLLFAKTWVLPFYTFFSRFLGALFYLQLASFHHWGQNKWHRTHS
jgi:hypothetical protein